MHGKCTEGTCSAPALSCQRLAHPLVGLRGFEPLNQFISQVGRQVDFQMSSDDDVCVANLLGEGVRVRVARRELLHLAQLEEEGDIFGREFGLRVLQQIIAAKVVLEHFILRGSGSQRATISGLLDHCQGVQVRLGARVGIYEVALTSCMASASFLAAAGSYRRMSTGSGSGGKRESCRESTVACWPGPEPRPWTGPRDVRVCG